MSDDLNAVATEAMSSDTQSSYEGSTTTKESPAPIATADTKTASTATATVEKPKAVVNQTTTEPKLSRRQAAAKRESEVRQALEAIQRENAELKRQFQESQKPILTQQQKEAEARRQEELKAKYATDPLATQQQLTQQMIQQAIQPFQQQAEQARIVQESRERIDFIKKFAGSEEAYKEAQPHMQKILENLLKTNPDDANRLAQAPELLFRVARDIANEQKLLQNKQVETQNQEAKADVAKFNGGVSRPNKATRTPLVNNKETIRQNAYDYIKQITGASR